MPLFKMIAPLISYRVYFSYADEVHWQLAFDLLYDDKLKLWYLYEDEYNKLNLVDGDGVKEHMKPFKAYGRHQHFL